MKLGNTSFDGRSRAGKGKLFYGLSSKHLEKLRSVGTDETLKLNNHVRSLAEFAVVFVKHARDLAKSGQKDSARMWWKFFFNSQICDVLESFPQIETQKQLRADLEKLRAECHPEENVSWQTDIEAVRYCLEEILRRVPGGVERQAKLCRTVLGRDGVQDNQPKTFERDGVMSRHSVGGAALPP